MSKLSAILKHEAKVLGLTGFNSRNYNTKRSNSKGRPKPAIVKLPKPANKGVCIDTCYIYLYRWSKGNDSFLKYGITDKAVTDNRARVQASKTEYNYKLIMSVALPSRELALSFESKVKSKHKTGYVSRAVFPDGYTETVEDSTENLTSIIGIMSTMAIRHN